MNEAIEIQMWEGTGEEPADMRAERLHEEFEAIQREERYVRYCMECPVVPGLEGFEALCGCCHQLVPMEEIQRRRRNTQYEDDESNHATVCYWCYLEDEENMADLWRDLRMSQLGY